MLTKLDIAALRKADALVVHYSYLHPEGLVRAIKRFPKTDRNPFAQDVEHVIKANVTLHGSRAKQAFEQRLVKCCAHVGFYHEQGNHESSVIKTLRVGDEITFRFYPDAHSNTYAKKNGLHADVLYLDVRRKNGKTTTYMQWELDNQICEENSARMCQGVPLPD